MLIALLYIACTPEVDDTADTGTEEDTYVPEVAECPDVELRFDGDDPPRVGSVWTIWLTCEGTVLMGASRIAITPVEAATNVDNELTWAIPGEATIEMQTGQTKGSLTVTVLE